MILYHYTSKDSYEGITKSKKWYPSNGFIQTDSAHGHGWYMTDMDPEKCDGWTVAYCWQRVDQEIFGKVEYYLKLDVPDFMVKKGREHVYLIPEHLWTGDLNSYGTVKYLDGGKTRKCSTSVSCWICTKIQEIKTFLNRR
jgi:hypothetical protein